jgi:putative aminopeptidase FrvX
MGSLLCRRNSRKKPKKGDPKKVMLLCHMDEIGFLVSHVTDKGFVHVQPVGGFDARNLFSRRVLVSTDDGDYKGVMNPGGKPIHISSPEERKKVPEPKDFVVDLGLGEGTKDLIKVGDMVTMDEPLIEIGDKIVSKALDNRIACWLGIEAIKRWANPSTNVKSMSPSPARKRSVCAARAPRPSPSNRTSDWASTLHWPATRRACRNRTARRCRAKGSAFMSRIPASLPIVIW